MTQAPPGFDIMADEPGTRVFIDLATSDGVATVNPAGEGQVLPFDAAPESFGFPTAQEAVFADLRQVLSRFDSLTSRACWIP